MRILDSTRLFTVIFTLGVFAVFRESNSETLYVDNKLSASSTKTYSINNRNGNGNNGKAFKTIQMALDSMRTGDVICLRGGIYPERRVTISHTKNGTSWNTGKFNSMVSFPGEWAVIDGQKNILTTSGDGPCLLGNTSSQVLKFWRFERIELRNGATADGQNASGFFGNQGPFHFRYCVFRDNIVNYEGNNPGGLKGRTWMDCVVEYCYFYNNGAPASHWNSTHINIFADYDEDNIAKNGFVYKNWHTMGNTFRYNLFESGTGPAVAIKYKNETYLTGRNPSAGKGYDDTWKDRGDHIHNNIFRKTKQYAISANQDFLQIYNNIFDSCQGSVMIGEFGENTMYKVTVYNNTILGNGKNGMLISHDQVYSFQEPSIIHYVYNNIFDNCADDWNKCDITLLRDPSWTVPTNTNNFKIDRNFIYRPATNTYDPNGTYVFWYGYTNDAAPRHTQSAYNSRFPDSKLYYAKADGANPLFRGTSGAARMITRGEYKFSDQETIANAGKNISHPFLNGKRIPGYIGATDPNDSNNNKWISDVLSLVNLSNNTMPNPEPADTQENSDPTPVQSKEANNQKFGISKLFQSRLTNDLNVEFSAPPTANKVTVSLYTLTGQTMIRESRHLKRGRSVQSVGLSLNDLPISNGNYVIKLTMKDDNGTETQYKSPVFLINSR